MSILAPSARLVGSRINRKEDPRLLTGRGRYVDDVVVPGMLHVAFARSDIAAAASWASTLEAARGAVGVVAVLTAADLNHLLAGPMGATPMLSMGPAGPYKVLADDEVRYVGDPYALVVAESRALAEDALELIELDVEPLSRRRLHDRARDRRARASRYRYERRRRDADATGRRAAPDPRDRAPRGDRDLRAEPVPRGPDGDPRHRGLVAAPVRLVRRVGVHPVAPRRAHRHQPHHRRPREPHPGPDGRRGRRLRPEGLPRPRRADRAARQPPPRPAAQVDRGPAREPVGGHDVARRAVHGHDRGRRRRNDPRHRGRPPRRGRRLSASRERGRHGRGHLHRAVPHPEAGVRVTVGVHQHLLTRALPRTVAVRDLLPRAGRRRPRPDAGHRPARAPPTQRAAARRAPVHAAAGHPPVRRVAGRDARASRVDDRLRRVPRVAARSSSPRSASSASASACTSSRRA